MGEQPPIWKWPPFAAQLLDPFAQGCELEGAGKLTHSFTLLQERLTGFPRGYLNLWSDEQFTLLETITNMFKDTMELYAFEEKIKDGDGLAMYAAAWGQKLDELQAGNFIFLPAGWADGIRKECYVVLLLERVSADEFRVTLCNKGQGLEYHPCSVREAPKIKYQACMCLGKVPTEKICDRGFLMMLFSQRQKHESHRVEVFYDAIIGWLTNRSLFETLQHVATTESDGLEVEYRTKSRSEMSCYFSLLEALRCVLRRKGVSIPQLKQLTFGLRRAMVHAASEELQALLDGSSRAGRLEPGASLLRALDLVEGQLLSAGGAEGGALSKEGVVGFYFSAHWCPPCRAFTPLLASCYASLRAAGKAFEVVFVSADRSPAAFANYHSTMPWPAVPLASAATAQLARMLGVRGYPTLVLLDAASGALLAADGRQLITNDPSGAGFPWAPTASDVPLTEETAAEGAGASAGAGAGAGLARGEAYALRMAAQQLAHAALREHSAGRLADAELACVEEESERVRAHLRALCPPPSAAACLPPRLAPAKAAAPSDAPFPLFDLLLRTGEDRFRGAAFAPRPPAPLDLLALPRPGELTTAVAAVAAIGACIATCHAVLERDAAAASSATSRLLRCQQVVQLLSHLLTEVLPLPLPPDADNDACVWAQRLPQALQLQAVQHIYAALHLLGAMWQDFSAASRVYESQRAVMALCALAILDVVVRTPASDHVLSLTELLTEDGGRSLSLDVGKRLGSGVDKVSALFELRSPALAVARDAALAYLTAVKHASAAEILHLPLFHGGESGLVMELSKESPTIAFVRALLERVGLPLMPPGADVGTEMEALVLWLGSSALDSETPFGELARKHPEVACTRDALTLFKFLTSMTSRTQEQLRLGAAQSTRHYTLSFDMAGAASAMATHHRPAPLFWQVVRVRGSENQFADVNVYGFGERKLVWGEGAVITSPAAVSAMLNRPSPTEEDVLHWEKLPRFSGTLSNEESESLLSFLTVGYVRAPLVAHFFADLQEVLPPGATEPVTICGNRISFLFNDQLQALLRAVLLEQGEWVSEAEGREGLMERVPMRRTVSQAKEFQRLRDLDARVSEERQALGTATGTLLNELRHSPRATLGPLALMLKHASELDKASVHSNTASFVLFLVELAVTVESFLVRAIAEPDAMRVAAHVLPELRTCLADLQQQLRGPILALLQRWLAEAAQEVSTDGKRTGNLPTMVVLQAFIALVWSNLVPEELSAPVVANLLGALAFVRGHHCYGQVMRNVELEIEDHSDQRKVEKVVSEQLLKFLQAQGVDTAPIQPEHLKRYLTGDPVWFLSGQTCIRVPLAGVGQRSQGFMAPPREVPEDELAFVTQASRRLLVDWLAKSSPAVVDSVMEQTVRIALRNPDFQCAGWAVQHGMPQGMYAAPRSGILVDVQTAEVMYRDAEICPVPESMCAFDDFERVFGKEALQCATLFHHERRKWVEVVGEEFELIEWDAPDKDELGIGAPSPRPSLAFPQGTVDPALVLETLRSLDAGKLIANVQGQPAAPIADKIIGLYFSAHWCPPCRQFTPRLAEIYAETEAAHPEFEIVFVSGDRSQEQFDAYFETMPWAAVSFAEGASRQRLNELFDVQGIPTLVLLNAATGQVINMDGREAVANNPDGFPWGDVFDAAAVKASSELEAPNAITYNARRYTRPFEWYHADPDQPPPDLPPSERWLKHLLSPVLEAIYPAAPPDQRMNYTLYMPEEVLSEHAATCTLIGLENEGKQHETWKEVVVLKDLRVVHVYNLVSHGRRMYRRQVFSSVGAKALASMDPMHFRAAPCKAIPRVILHASGDWKRAEMNEATLVIARVNRQLGGRETLVPARLLGGLVPSALLDAFKFWQGEDLVIRGEPRDHNDEWFGYNIKVVTEGADGRVAATIVRQDTALEPMRDARALEQPHPFVRSRSSTSATSSSDERPPSLRKEMSLTTRLAPLLDLGYSEGEAAAALDLFKTAEGRERYAKAEAFLSDAWTRKQLAAAGLARGPSTVLEDCAPAADDDDEPGPVTRYDSTWGGVAAGGRKAPPTAAAAAALDATCLVLVNLLQSAAGTPIHRLVSVLTRIEDISHVLVWAKASGGAGEPAESIIMFVELPRLKLRFQPRAAEDGSGMRLYSLDHSGWFVSDSHHAPDGTLSAAEAAHVAQLLVPVPHCLVLEDAAANFQVLIPNHEARRPKVQQEPFSTELVFHRGAPGWVEVMNDTPYYLLSVHTSRTYLVAPLLEATIYLVMLHLQARDYQGAAKLADAMTVDVDLTATEQWIFNLLRYCTDQHPDAHAVRLKILLALQHSNNVVPFWSAEADLEGYLAKAPHVSQVCRLRAEEELAMLLAAKNHAPLLRLRKAYLDALASGKRAAELECPRPEAGGRAWAQGVLQASATLLAGQALLSKFSYKHPTESGAPVAEDGEVGGILFENLVMDDSESGGSRQLGFLFLYQLLTGAVSLSIDGHNVSHSLGQLLTRAFHLKTCSWGKSAAVGQPTAAICLLAAVQDWPSIGWPQMPTDAATLELLGGEGGINTLRRTSDEDAQDFILFINILKSQLDSIKGTPRWETLRETRKKNWEGALAHAAEHLAVSGSVALEAPAMTHALQASNLSQTTAAIVPCGVGNCALTEADIASFAAHPLSSIGFDAYVVEVRSEEGAAVTLAGDAFFKGIAEHSSAGDAVAKDVLRRTEEDMAVYKQQEQQKSKVRRHLKHLSKAEVCAMVESADLTAVLPNLEAALGSLRAAASAVSAVRQRSVALVSEAIDHILAQANKVESAGAPRDDVAQVRFRLRRFKDEIPTISMAFLIQALLSTEGAADIQRLNPHCTEPAAVLQLLQAVLLHSNRIAHASRALSSLLGLSQSLAQLRAKRQAGALSRYEAEVLQIKVSHEAASTLETLMGARHYVRPDTAQLDPRFLVFEFLFNLLLRDRQVEMVQSFMQRAAAGRSSCQQMIMGAGKTTVVGPLLALCLADGQSLVTQIMPAPLLEMSRNVLRGIFGAMIQKRIYTLSFDRSMNSDGGADPAVVYNILERLRAARDHRGIVCSTPEAVKSLALKFVEQLHALEAQSEAVAALEARLYTSGEGRAAKDTLAALQDLETRAQVADAIADVFDIWEQGVLIMDEVDVILHPLKSELNFPIGQKLPIDLTCDRWDLPMHLLELAFVLQDLPGSGLAATRGSSGWAEAQRTAGVSGEEVVAAMKGVLEAGRDRFSLQRSPHLVLLDLAYYSAHIRPLAAKWALLWLHQNCPDTLPPSAELLLYLEGLPVDKASLALPSPYSMKLINLASSWVTSFLPHCLSKIDRVSYGLLRASDSQAPSAPESRRLMAVPFVGKDVPSRSSEFAHPDVLIGLSVLAYRYEALREEDVHRIAKTLKADFAQQLGNKKDRPAAIKFEEWKNVGRAKAAALGRAASMVLSLDLFQPEDRMQVRALCSLIGDLPCVVHDYLRQYVFPDTMNFQTSKISACGHEVGSSLLFGRRIGFSGTPSSLMPKDLGVCMYEPGSDGKIINFLTSPAIVSSEMVSAWSARGLLEHVARHEPPFHALIDTGALVTGMDNLEVAEVLLECLPVWFEAVVYLDSADRCMALVRRTRRAVALNQCGVPLGKRFAFYDQVHTTGMDIKHTPNATAMLTLGKDMTFRDYAQGAFRMRGIGSGQCVQLYIIPEVAHRIAQDLAEVGGLYVDPAAAPSAMAVNAAAWLMCNQLRSNSLQHLQLQIQELHNVYRKVALRCLSREVATAAAAAAGTGTGTARARRSKRFVEGSDCAVLRAAIEVFREPISHDVSDAVAEPKDLMGVMEGIRASRAPFVALVPLEPAADARIEEVLAETKASVEAKRGGGGAEHGSGEMLDATREQQQEQQKQQEQMKEQEEEQQQMSQFSRDEEAPLPWMARTLAAPPSLDHIAPLLALAPPPASAPPPPFAFASLSIGDQPFYPLSVFQAAASQPSLPFPPNILVSSNWFRPRWAGMGDRRLKNVSLVMEWVPAGGARQLVVLTLAEAETVRRMLHTNRYAILDPAGGGYSKLARPLDASAQVALHLLNGHSLDLSCSFDAAASRGDASVKAALQCLRFFNSDMYFSDEQLALLMRSLAAASVDDSARFFEENLRRRRRERRLWGDTPVAKLFTEKSAWDSLRAQAIVEAVRGKLHAQLRFAKNKLSSRAKLLALLSAERSPFVEEEEHALQCSELMDKVDVLDAELAGHHSSLEQVFASCDADADGLLNRSDLMSFLQALRCSYTTADITAICGMAASARTDSTLSCADFCQLFAMPAALAEDVAEAAPEEEAFGVQPWECPSPSCAGLPPNVPEATICVYCMITPRPDLVASGVLAAPGAPAGKWECSTCHLYNADRLFYCEVCNTAKDATNEF